MLLCIVVTIYILTDYDKDLLSGAQLDMTPILQTDIRLTTEDDIIRVHRQKAYLRVSVSAYNMSKLRQQGDKLSPYCMLRAENTDA